MALRSSLDEVLRIAGWTAFALDSLSDDGDDELVVLLGTLGREPSSLPELRRLILAPAAVNYGFSVPCPLLCTVGVSICCGGLWVLSPMPAPSYDELLLSVLVSNLRDG